MSTPRCNANHDGFVKQYLELIKTFAPDATPYMEQDRINKRPSEVELFAGTVIHYAKTYDRYSGVGERIPLQAGTGDRGRISREFGVLNLSHYGADIG